MNRRTFLQLGVVMALESRLRAAAKDGSFDDAADVLTKAVASGQVAAAVMHVARKQDVFTRAFGKAKSADAMFLLGSISKPICMTGLMSLYDKGLFGLDDLVQKFVPKFTGDGRERVTMKHLLTHTSGLPDQLADNDALRKKHAGLEEFVDHTVRTPLSFAPGSKYQYSSMAINLAAHIGSQLSAMRTSELVQKAVFGPLAMNHCAVGLGRFSIQEMVSVQTEHAAPESGGGDPTAKEWDWNSEYWRNLGAPWGGVHASAPDLGAWLVEFLYSKGSIVGSETEKLMVTNQNKPGIKSRGLGFDVGASVGNARCSENTFGHTGSTGTLCWADPATKTTCVVLTTLPARAVTPHPRDLVSQAVANSAR